LWGGIWDYKKEEEGKSIHLWGGVWDYKKKSLGSEKRKNRAVFTNTPF
jgi:hypothetical protein